MHSLFLQDLKRGFWNKGFTVGMLFASALLFPAVFLDSNLSGNRSYLNTLGNAFHSSAFPQLAAVFPCLAYAARFCEEYHSGYLGMIMARTGHKNFARVRICTVALSGGVMLAVPVGAVCLIAYATGMHGVPSGWDEGLLSVSLIPHYIEAYGDWFVLVGKTVCGFLGGALWALVGLAFAVWIRNRYVAVLAPFVLYDSLWMVLGYTPFNPLHLLVGDDIMHGKYHVAAGMELVYIAITIWFIVKGMGRAVHGEA